MPQCGGGEMSRGTHPCVCACIEYLWKVWFPAGGDFVPPFWQCLQTFLDATIGAGVCSLQASSG